MTPAARKLMDALAEHGEVWVVPSQLRLARRLQAAGHLIITAKTRQNIYRGSSEHRVVPKPVEREADTFTSPPGPEWYWDRCPSENNPDPGAILAV